MPFKKRKPAGEPYSLENRNASSVSTIQKNWGCAPDDVTAQPPAQWGKHGLAKVARLSKLRSQTEGMLLLEQAFQERINGNHKKLKGIMTLTLSDIDRAIEMALDTSSSNTTTTRDTSTANEPPDDDSQSNEAPDNDSQSNEPLGDDHTDDGSMFLESLRDYLLGDGLPGDDSRGENSVGNEPLATTPSAIDALTQNSFSTDSPANTLSTMSQVEELKTQLNSLQKENASLTSDLNKQKTRNDGIDQIRAALLSEQRLHEETKRGYDEQVRLYQNLDDTSTKERAGLNSRIDSLTARNDELAEQNVRNAREHAELKRKTRSVEELASTSAASNATLQQELNHVRNELAVEKAGRHHYEDMYSETLEELRAVRGRAVRVEHQKEQADHTCRDLQQQLNRTTDDMRILSETLKQAQEQKLHLETQYVTDLQKVQIDLFDQQQLIQDLDRSNLENENHIEQLQERSRDTEHHYENLLAGSLAQARNLEQSVATMHSLLSRAQQRQTRSR